MAITFRDNSAAFKTGLRHATAEGLQRAGVLLYNECVKAVNKSNTHRHVAKFTPGQSAKRGGQKTGQVFENMRNRYAGQPPFKRTGFGQSQIAYNYNGNERHPVVQVGVKKNAMYLLYLELGTRRILARPWLLATLKKNWDKIKRLAVSGGRGT